MRHKPLIEQVIVIVGASSGIGRATALAASAAGAKVVAARGQEALDTLVADAGPGQVVVTSADAADPQSMRDLAAFAVERFGRIDAWAHVAGVSQYARFQDHTPEEFRRIVEVDLLGPVYGAMAALPRLRGRGGALVIVSSEIAKRGFPLASAYSAAKHGVNGFVEALRVELAHEHVPVSLTEVQPGPIATPFFEHARTKLGVRPSCPPPVYAPERAAAVILQAAQHGCHTLIVGGAAKAQLLLQRVSPQAMDLFSRATAFRLQRSNEPKGSADSNNLDGPVEGDDRVRGDVTTTHR